MLNHDVVQDVLQGLVKSGHITARTKWKDVYPAFADDARYLDILGNPGSNPLELFWDIVDGMARGRSDLLLEIALTTTVGSATNHVSIVLSCYGIPLSSCVLSHRETWKWELGCLRERGSALHHRHFAAFADFFSTTQLTRSLGGCGIGFCLGQSVAHKPRRLD